MKTLKKAAKGFFVVCVLLVILALLADLAWILIPQIKAQSKIEGLSDVAQTIDRVSAPAQAEVIALGEASHGNLEFQEIKLSLLQQLAERQGVKAFALEMDLGEGLLVNRYIQGLDNAATAAEVVSGLSFSIYHTRQMTDLIQWMHDYNATAAPEQRLFFYGFDLQNPRTGLKLLLPFCEENQVLPGLDKTPLQDYIDGNYSITSEQAQAALQCIDAIETELANTQRADLQNSEDFLLMRQILCCARNFAACLEEGGADNYIRYNTLRDRFMAENVLWILEQMKGRGRRAILISGHNGHIAFEQQFYTPMGNHLKEALGNRYFAIGTDYYKTVCNINAAGPDTARADHAFCSADPFAANAKALGGSYYLDFSSAQAQNGAAWELLNTDVSMGSLGEGYSWLMRLLPTSHRIKAKPIDLYHAMLFFYKTAPIRVQ